LLYYITLIFRACLKGQKTLLQLVFNPEQLKSSCSSFLCYIFKACNWMQTPDFIVRRLWSCWL